MTPASLRRAGLPVGHAAGRSSSSRYWTQERNPSPALLPPAPATSASTADPADASWIAASGRSAGDDHPLVEHALGVLLRERARRISEAFDAIEPVMRELAAAQFGAGFGDLARRALQDRLGLVLPDALLHSSWTTPLDVRRLYARCVMETFLGLVDQGFQEQLARLSEEEAPALLIRRWGFHAVDIAACADGRLSGVLDYILRIPASVVTHRHSYAGAMFDVEDSVRHWESIELRRWRDGWPNAAADPTRFLKIGVYHFSGTDSGHGGCAAHGSDTQLAAGRLLERLEQFAQAVAHLHGARPAILLVGVDTDTDAIRVHVPDAAGGIDTARHVDNARLHDATRWLARDAAKEAIRAAVADCAGVAADDPGSTGMRWLCGYLLKNNLSQYAAVRALPAGRYPDAGHTERLIVVGDAIDAVQLRNLSFQAQMDTVEEGARDLEVGIHILRGLHEPKGLAVPVLVHCAHRAGMPGAKERAQLRAQRLRNAVTERHADLVASGILQVHAITLPGSDVGPATPITTSVPAAAHERLQ